MFNRILVPTDFSDPSDAALEYARGLAKAFDASLHVLHVISTPFAAEPAVAEAIVGGGPPAYAELFDRARAALHRRVSPADRSQLGATTEILGGNAAEAIVEYANDRAIDLIVIGTHGRSGVARLLVGSVAEKVVRAAACPVMTVRGSGAVAGVWRGTMALAGA